MTLEHPTFQARRPLAGFPGASISPRGGLKGQPPGVIIMLCEISKLCQGERAHVSASVCLFVRSFLDTLLLLGQCRMMMRKT